jgi:hypothetical protein
MAFITVEDSNFQWTDSDTLTTYFSQTAPIFSYPDNGNGEQKADTLLQGVMKAVLTPSDIPEELLKSLGRLNLASNLDQYFVYGRDQHPYGLPDFKRYKDGSSLNDASAKEALANHFSVSVSNINLVNWYYTTGPLPITEVTINTDPDTFYEDVLIYLQYKIDYNAYTRTVDMTKAAEVLGVNWGVNNFSLYTAYLNNYVLSVDTDENGKFFINLTTNYSLVVNSNSQKIPVSNNFKYDIASISTDFHVFEFLKTTEDSSQPLRRFLYPQRSKYRDYEDPTIAVVRVRDVSKEDLYPMMPLIVQGRPLTNKRFKDQNLVNKTKELAKRLGMDLEDLIDGLRRGNPSFADTHTAYLLVGASLNSANKYELQYLFDYFTDPGLFLEQESSGVRSFSLHWKETDAGTPFYQKTFSAIVSSIETYTGTIPKKVSRGRFGDLIDEAGNIAQGNAGKVLHYVGERGRKNTYRTLVRGLSYSIAKQVTNNKWIEVTLLVPASAVAVGNGVFTVISTADLLKGTEELRVPIQRSRLLAYPKDIQQEIVLRSLCLQIGGFAEENLKFYETSDFAAHIKRLHIVIAIIVAIFNYGDPGSQAIINYLFNLLINLVINYVISIVISEIFQLLAKEVGGEAAAVITIIGVALTFYYTGGFGTEGYETLDFVDDVFTITNAVSSNYQIWTAEEIEQLQQEADLFAASAQEVFDKLDEINEELKGLSIDPTILAILEQDSIIIESPTEFISRTIIGNPGVLLLDGPRNYVGRNIQLPDINPLKPLVA